MKTLSVTLAVASVMALAGSGLAQTVNPLPPVRPGHLIVAPDQRQPTDRELPPGIVRSEGKITEGQKQFDKQLRICRDC